MVRRPLLRAHRIAAQVTAAASRGSTQANAAGIVYDKGLENAKFQAEAPKTADGIVKIQDGANYYENVTSWPVVDPYGHDIDMAELGAIREEERKPQRAYIEALKKGEATAMNDSMAYMWQRKGQWPYSGRDAGVNPLTATPEVTKMLKPVLNQLVENLQKKTTAMPWEPHVVNGYETYCDPVRFAGEMKHMFMENVLLAGLSNDLPGPGTEKHWEQGKPWQLRLSRDVAGAFQAFSSMTNRPAAAREIAGLLLVIPNPPEDEAALEALYAEAMPPELQAELEKYSPGKHFCLATQSMKVDSNWKLGIDTFGETYHFAALHPFLREAATSNTQVFRKFGKNHGCMTFGRFTTRMMAAGEVEESRWTEPSLIDHLTMVYHIAPNTVFLVGSQTIAISQHWPGETPGEHFVNLQQYYPALPASDKDREIVKRGMSGLIDTVATEDFPCLPKMQANFESNRHAEVVFGRNEPALTDRHRYFARAAQPQAAPVVAGVR